MLLITVSLKKNPNLRHYSLWISLKTLKVLSILANFTQIQEVGRNWKIIDFLKYL